MDGHMFPYIRHIQLHSAQFCTPCSYPLPYAITAVALHHQGAWPGPEHTSIAQTTTHWCTIGTIQAETWA